MDITQVSGFVNEALKQSLGEENLLQEDLKNIVDVGEAIFNAKKFDAYTKALVNHIGKVIFVTRNYQGRVPSVLMESWEFGSVLEKITMQLPESEENESWELVDRTSYDPNIFYKPIVTAKFFNKKTTFEIPISITELQVKQSFSNQYQLNAFVSMIYTAVKNAMTINNDNLIMRTINNFIGETVYEAYQSGTTFNTKGNARAVNLLAIYNEKFTKTLTPSQAITDPDFLRFASLMLLNYVGRMRVMSSLFNMGGEARYTPRDLLHIVMLDDFVNGANVYLQSNTFHNELTAFPKFESVPYWQGSGKDFDFSSTSSIDIITTSGQAVKLSGIVAVMWDRDALGVTNYNERVKTHYNEKAEFTNNWFKKDAGYFNDFNENFVVFFLA